MTPEQERRQQEQIQAILDLLQAVNVQTIEQIAQQIKKIGKLNKKSIDRLTIMAAVNEDIAAINKAIAKAADLSTQELMKLFNEALNDTYTDPRFQRALKQEPLTPAQRRRFEWYTASVAAQAAGAMQNLSHTTIVDKVYRQAVDEAITAVSLGVDDYQSATRKVVEDLGGSGGVQVEYPSGYHRRLDSAARMNILDGVREVNQTASLGLGEILQYEGVELSAHGMPAPDHAPIQGRIFLLSEFEKMQNEQPFQDINGKQYPAMKRAIGKWNCMHFAMSYDTRYCRPRYTEEQLQAFQQKNERGCEHNDKQMTLYEASQRMRQIETAIRHQKETAIAAKAAGDDELRRKCQKKINALTAEYNSLCEDAGLTARPERMRVPGFRSVRV